MEYEYEPKEEEEESTKRYACHDCEYWRQLIENANQELNTNQELTTGPSEEHKLKLQSRLREFVLGQLEHQRQTHR